MIGFGIRRGPVIPASAATCPRPGAPYL